MKVIRANSTLCIFLNTTKSYNLRNLNLVWKSPLPQIEGYQRSSLLCKFFLRWNPTIWEIDSPISMEMRVIKILSNLKHVLLGIAAKTLILQLSSFCSFFMVFILQSEECEIEWNKENSPDWRKSYKLPHFVWFPVYLDPTIWGILVWNVN